ncbi:AAA family ATPase [Streptomyces zaomyceticus]|uniref:AAA family ATPase n=1 Tax=Streptomyces zaomyceticus TaxID=68286 RepID=UPI003794FF93
MELRRVTLTNYRAFQRVDWELPPTGLVFVAGANNSGKSSLLSALDVIAGSAEYDPSIGYQNAQSSDKPIIWASFKLPTETRERIVNSIAWGARTDLNGIFEEVHFAFELSPGDGFIISEIHTSWSDSGQVGVAGFKPRGSHQHELWAIGPNQSGAPHDRPSLSKRVEGQFTPSMESMLSGIKELAPLWEELQAWRSRFYHFKALRGGAPRSIPLTSEQHLDPTGNNLPAVLLDLQTNRSRLMDELRSVMAQMVPDVGRLETPTSNNQLQVAFSDPFNERSLHNLKELGTGVEQLLLTLVVGLTQEPSATLIMEEPETNLHPSAQRALLGLLNTWSSDRLIIAATHSPVMLDWTPAGNRLWQVTRHQGASRVSIVEEFPQDLFHSLGVRLSDVLSADRILIVEGPSDIDVLSAWFPELIRNPRVSIIPGGGGDNARFSNLFAEWLTGIDRLGSRRVLYLRDRDELPLEVVEKLTQSENVHVLNCREIENYLLDPQAISSNLSRQPNLQASVNPDAVREEIEQCVESLKGAMVVNRVARRLPGVRLVDNVMRGGLAKKGASQNEFWEVIESRLPKVEAMRKQIAELWDTATNEVATMTVEELVKWAPGEEILDAVYMKFLGRRFKKRADGGALAATMGQPPAELSALLSRFMSDAGETP